MIIAGKTTNPLARAAMLLGAAATLAVLAVGPAGAATNKATGECFTYYLYQFNSGGVRIHQKPGTGSTGGIVFGLGYAGEQFHAFTGYEPVYRDSYEWVYGQDLSTGVTGWAARPYLDYLGNVGTCLM